LAHPYGRTIALSRSTVAETQRSTQELARMSAELQSVVANFRV